MPSVQNMLCESTSFFSLGVQSEKMEAAGRVTLVEFQCRKLMSTISSANLQFDGMGAKVDASIMSRNGTYLERNEKRKLKLIGN